MSPASYMLTQLEQKIGIRDTSGSLRERTERIATIMGD
jgi:hypothetical protein